MTNVLLIYESYIPSVRLCAYEQLNYLMKIQKINFIHCSVKKLNKEMCLTCDIVVFVRGASIYEEKLAELFKKNGKLMIYTLDDDLLNVVEGLPSSDYYRRQDVKDRIIHIMKLCDILITPSNILVQKYGDLFQKTVMIEEPCLSHVKVKERDSASIVKIGFAGSIDRAEDIDELLSEVIRQLINKYGKRISIEFMGAKPNIVKELNLKYYPYEENYDIYREKLERLGWDIGLAPMPDTEFHNGKHYIKYIEYSTASITGVYSDVEPYNRIINHGLNGLLCHNTVDDWLDALSTLIDNDEIRIEINRYNRLEMEKDFDIATITKKLEENLPELLEYKVNKRHNILFTKVKVEILFYRIIDYIKRYGIKAPYFLIRRLCE